VICSYADGDQFAEDVKEQTANVTIDEYLNRCSFAKLLSYIYTC